MKRSFYLVKLEGVNLNLRVDVSPLGLFCQFRLIVFFHKNLIFFDFRRFIEEVLLQIFYSRMESSRITMQWTSNNLLIKNIQSNPFGSNLLNVQFRLKFYFDQQKFFIMRKFNNIISTNRYTYFQQNDFTLWLFGFQGSMYPYVSRACLRICRFLWIFLILNSWTPKNCNVGNAVNVKKSKIKRKRINW